MHLRPGVLSRSADRPPRLQRRLSGCPRLNYTAHDDIVLWRPLNVDTHSTQTSGILRPRSVLALPCLLLCAWASHGEARSEAQGVDPALLEKARRIVEVYTPDKKVHVRALDTGLRVVGVSVTRGDMAATPARRNEPAFEWTPPDWQSKDALLGYVDAGGPLKVRLLWRKEPAPPGDVETVDFAVALNHHRGYYKMSPVAPWTTIRLDDHAYGTVFWTEHAFAGAAKVPPGVFDLIVSTTGQSAEVIPLGQVFIRGEVHLDPNGAGQLSQLFPSGRNVFTNQLAMTRWQSYTFQLDSPGAPPRQIAIVSSVDWLEAADDGMDVAEVTLVRKSGKAESHFIKLGRDTASTWYELHKRGDLKHSRAPVAWSWPVTQDTVRFDAAVYTCSFALEDDPSPPREVRIRYLANEGLLRLHGISLLP
jgi:hypothetical protein